MHALAAAIKLSAMGRGVAIDRDASERLSDGGRVPLSIHEYATTGGVTLVFNGNVYVNAPFDEWYVDEPEVELRLGPDSEFEAAFRGERYPVRVLPLPGYLATRDARGRPVREVVMSHADRARVSPISGCAYRCAFCDYWMQPYVARPVEQVLAGLDVALADEVLPVAHVLVSGGTPVPGDRGYYLEVCRAVLARTELPVDFMLAAWSDRDMLRELVDLGAHGFAINLELYDPEIAAQLAPQKAALGLDGYASAIETAVALTGGGGRVRSLLLLGLEPLESTLQGVEFLASLGCDPVLSPFRPADRTRLSDVRPPVPELLAQGHAEAMAITEKHGVQLGPRCVPCQHNTLTLPDQVSASGDSGSALAGGGEA